jgi:fatty acid desaturase
MAETVDIRWYRVPLDREKMRKLARRTDGEGLLQTLGFLLLLCASAAAAWLAWGRLPWWAVLILLFAHGTFFAFLLNGFHELVHGTVFKTKALNTIFLYIYSFFSWNSHVGFKASHNKHHLNTLHPPYDLEVVLPIQLKPAGFFLAAVIDVVGIYGVIRDTILLSFGVVRGEWQLALFPPSDEAARRPLVRWARIMLIGHVAIVAVSAVTGLWQLAVVTTFARFYGGWLQWICNNTQHVGLQDNVEDFRLCCRTVKLNPFVRFLYFHMNFHVEHHMYASIPCYHLGRLRKELIASMPRARWLIPARLEILGILRKQKQDPRYQYAVPLPAPIAAGHGAGQASA